MLMMLGLCTKSFKDTMLIPRLFRHKLRINCKYKKRNYYNTFINNTRKHLNVINSKPKPSNQKTTIIVIIINGPIHRTRVSPAKAGIMCRPITIWLAFGGIPWLRLVQINGHSDLVFVFLYLKTRYYMLFRYNIWQQSRHAFSFDIWILFMRFDFENRVKLCNEIGQSTKS